jgi:hypothetical protein
MRCLQLVLTLVVLAAWPSLACPSRVEARDYVFDGTWRTTNRPLDGPMTCVVTQLGVQKWQGRFYGVWQGAPFDYTVPFSGPTSQLRGTASIDGANYTWIGRIQEGTPASFQGRFGGDRYEGSFDLKERVKTAQARPGR